MSAVAMNHGYMIWMIADYVTLRVFGFVFVFGSGPGG